MTRKRASIRVLRGNETDPPARNCLALAEKAFHRAGKCYRLSKRNPRFDVPSVVVNSQSDERAERKGRETRPWGSVLNCAVRSHAPRGNTSDVGERSWRETLGGKQRGGGRKGKRKRKEENKKNVKRVNRLSAPSGTLLKESVCLSISATQLSAYCTVTVSCPPSSFSCVIPFSVSPPTLSLSLCLSLSPLLLLSAATLVRPPLPGAHRVQETGCILIPCRRHLRSPT